MGFYFIRIDTDERYRYQDIKQIIEEALRIYEINAKVTMVQY